MRTPSINLSLIIFLVFFSGCSSTAKTSPGGQTVESRQEAISAMQKVLTNVSGEEIDERKLRELNSQIQKNPEAKQAVESIANSMSGQGIVIKYCPVDGQRFSAKFTQCPEHKVVLKILND